ncbi:unnamed protein product, partial [Larinioides sclopetarius]
MKITCGLKGFIDFSAVEISTTSQITATKENIMPNKII